MGSAHVLVFHFYLQDGLQFLVLCKSNNSLSKQKEQFLNTWGFIILESFSCKINKLFLWGIVQIQQWWIETPTTLARWKKTFNQGISISLNH